MEVILTGSKIVNSGKHLSLKCNDLSEMSAVVKDFCPSCDSAKISIFYELGTVPVQSVLLVPTREKALKYLRGDISLTFCQTCGFIFNSAFDSALLEYSSTYEATQRFSPTFSAFAHDLAGRLIDRYDLHDKTVLEIGCGNGEFLKLLCKLGGNRGVGFDPSYVAEHSDKTVQKGVIFIKDFYSEKYAGYQADFVCCKMTLEHIQHTADFVGTVRRAIGRHSDTIVFFQVPDVTRILKDCAFEDIYYEHCSYFSPGSLARLFRKCGFDVLRLDTEYGGQYLVIEAKPENRKPPLWQSQEDDFEALRDYVSSFEGRCQKKLFPWQKQIDEIRKKNKRAVIWGSGSKGVAFLTTLKIFDEIEYAVDINPYRQGTYMPVTGQEIVSPEFLAEYRPDIVIIMNSVYAHEIKQDLTQLGLASKILTL
jgi:SAM-dependent methyltransferase